MTCNPFWAQSLPAAWELEEPVGWGGWAEGPLRGSAPSPWEGYSPSPRPPPTPLQIYPLLPQSICSPQPHHILPSAFPNK